MAHDSMLSSQDRCETPGGRLSLLGVEAQDSHHYRPPLAERHLSPVSQVAAPNSEVCRHTPDCISWSKVQKQYIRCKDEIDVKFQQIVRGSHPLVEDSFIRRDNR